MKKYTWIVALLLALSLAFLGCGGGEDALEGEGGEEEGVVKTLTIKANDYGKDAQGNPCNSGGATNGFQLTLKGEAAPLTTVAAGDKYVLTIEFTTNRDVAATEALRTGIVDTAPPAYWKPLTWSGDNADAIFETGVKAGEVVKKEIKFSGLSAAGTSLEDTALMFQTDMEPHTLGDLVLKCTVYEFAKE